MKLFMFKDGWSLKPSDERGEKALARMGQGELVVIDLRRNRNLLHHRKFWAILNAVLDNQNKYDNDTDLLTEIKIRVGHYREYITQQGELVYVPKSISFDECDQSEFDEFYTKAVNVMEEMVPGVSGL